MSESKVCPIMSAKSTVVIEGRIVETATYHKASLISCIKERCMAWSTQRFDAFGKVIVQTRECDLPMEEMDKCGDLECESCTHYKFPEGTGYCKLIG